MVHQIVLDTPKVSALFPDEVDNSIYIPKLLQDDPEDSGAVYTTPGLPVEETVSIEPPSAEFPDLASEIPEVPETPSSTPELASFLSSEIAETLLSALGETANNTTPIELNQEQPAPEQPDESAVKKPRAPPKKRGKAGFGSTGN